MNAQATPAHSQPWADMDLSRPSESAKAILDEYTFDALLMEAHCNLREITPQAVAEQFEQQLRSKVESAREVFRTNAEMIYLTAKAHREQDSEIEDDMGEPYEGEQRRVPYGSPEQRGAILVGAAGYLKLRRQAAEDGETLPLWSELEPYGA